MRVGHVQCSGYYRPGAVPKPVPCFAFWATTLNTHANMLVSWGILSKPSACSAGHRRHLTGPQSCPTQRTPLATRRSATWMNTCEWAGLCALANMFWCHLLLPSLSRLASCTPTPMSSSGTPACAARFSYVNDMLNRQVQCPVSLPG